jgi:hypothetical protein
MKTFLLLLTTITLSSCESNKKSKNYKDFSYQFRVKRTTYISIENEMKSWVEDGKKISLEPYFHLFEDSLNIETIIKDSILTLGKIEDVTTGYSFDLFLAKYIDKYLFIFVDKSKQSIINIFLSPPCSNTFKLTKIQGRFSANKESKASINFMKIGQKIMHGYKKPSKSISEIRYKLDYSAQVIFKEEKSYYNDNFHYLPEEHLFSGKYILNTNEREIELLVKDGGDPNSLTFWLKMLDLDTQKSIYRYGNHQILSSSNTLEFSEKKEEIDYVWTIELEFKGKEVEMIYNECELGAYKEIFCGIEGVLKKQ